MDMSFPTAQKVYLQSNQEDQIPDPTTSIDDLDDLYGDSPAINMYKEDGPLHLPDSIVPQPSISSLQPTSFQLPGLGLFTTELSEPEQVRERDNEAFPISEDTKMPPTSELQMIHGAGSTFHAQAIAAPDAPKAEQGIQVDQPDEGARDGLQNTEASGQSNISDATAGPVFKVRNKESQTSSGEQLREQAESEVSKPNPAYSLEDQAISVAQPSIDHSAIGNSIDQRHRMEECQTAPAGQMFKKEQDEAEKSNSEPAFASENKDLPVAQPPPHSSVSEHAAEQRAEGLASQIMQVDAEEDPSRHINNAAALSSNTDPPQPGLPQQTLRTEAVGVVKQPTFEEIAGANRKNDEAEFELDSSPIESSSESDSKSSSSSSGDSDYEMLDPEEEARRLMQEDGGSDDEGKGGKAPSGPLRTLNEKPDEVVPKPQIDITLEMTVLELGNVEHVVENSIVIKAKTSGESRVLESGSLLCLKDRSVVGVIAELLGQVQQPYYSVRFTNPAAIAEAGISRGTLIFYVGQHSSYVFTQSLKALKGSDASNMHDEEVADDELEFSDDEAEAEYKRRVKQEKQARRGDREERGDRAGRGGGAERRGRGNRGDGFSRRPREGHLRGSGRGDFNQSDGRGTSDPVMNYDDNDDREDLYTPLARPSNLHEIMGRVEAPQEDLNNRVNGNLGSREPQRGGKPDRGRGRGDRGRGDRGRGGRGGRGDWRGRGGFNGESRSRQYDNQEQQHTNHTPTSPHLSNGYPSVPFPTTGTPAPPPYGWPNQFPPNHSVPTTPLYQQPPYPSPQQPYTTYSSNTYNQAYSPPQQLYPPHQSLAPNYNQNHPSYQASSPTSPVPPNIPPGAHINPAFFSPPIQQVPQPWQQQQQMYSNHAPQTEGARSPQSEEAFKAAQDRLDLLRMLTRNDASLT
ncbi:MAG: hypothetical protein Q9166_001493 [cf. Caloplaca sp. 2 TL-2023]